MSKRGGTTGKVRHNSRSHTHTPTCPLYSKLRNHPYRSPQNYESHAFPAHYAHLKVYFFFYWFFFFTLRNKLFSLLIQKNVSFMAKLKKSVFFFLFVNFFFFVGRGGFIQSNYSPLSSNFPPTYVRTDGVCVCGYNSERTRDRKRSMR